MPDPSEAAPHRRRYVPAVGPGLKKLLVAVLVLFSLLSINGGYLLAITVAEATTDRVLQDHFYLLMFLVHLLLGALFVVPFLVFGVVHMRNSWQRKNRAAVRVGYALFATGLVLLISGVVLVRLEGFLEVRDPDVRRVAYWAHVLSPLIAAWLFVLHRLAGPKIKWRVGGWIAAVGGAFALLMVIVHGQDPREWNVAGPASGEQYFFPSLSRTATGNFIPADALMKDDYCQECHADVHADWSVSAHRFASFNNPAYLFSVRETRRVALERDGDVQAARFCAGCHDLVPFFSGAFDDPDFDDVHHPTSQAGITCSGCHAITHVNSVRGNADYTIEEPLHYPFTDSENALMRWISRQLVKAKPDFHRKTFLKPLHQTSEFCGTCHKVHLPEELNHYKWLRGQNHYDAFRLSGVSGHGASSFYYPERAEADCNRCHMPLQESTDFGAKDRDGSGRLTTHDHQFPSANTAIPHLLGLGDDAIDAHRRFTEGTLRVDAFALRPGGAIDSPVLAPLRPEQPALVPGERYLLDVVIRTLKVGHLFTQGTADSNQVWLDVTLKNGDRVIGRSGATDDDGFVDPWSHFVNAYVLDRDGNRIDRRNAQDIFVTLYNHQIPPGAADVIHYAFDLPPDATGTLDVEVHLRYRKFDTTYMRYVYGEDYTNDLPVMTIASDRVVLPIGDAPAPPVVEVDFPAWKRWNDYGIGLLRKGESGSSKGELRQAEAAFREVGRLGRPDGALNRARVYFKEGRLEDAVAALTEASAFDPPAPPWTVAWFTGLVNQQNGHLDDAIESFESIVDTRFEDARRRGFDFSRDERVLNQLGATLFERAKEERGEERRRERDALLRRAIEVFERSIELDPEGVAAHYNLAQIHTGLGDAELAEVHRAAHARYKPDDNARDRAVAAHRAANPAADHASEAVVIYDLQREGAFGLPEQP